MGCYLDVDGSTRWAADDYRALHARPTPHYWRAALEMVMSLGAGTAWYWIDRERQVADWDYPSLRQRASLDVLRLDNNEFGINFLGHPLDGAAFHALSRANHLSLAESFGYGMATSLTWEYVLEFREKISINDIIVTPVAGVAVGEFAHRLGMYLNSAPGHGRWWHKLAGWTLGPIVATHHRLDGYRPAGGPGLDGGLDHLGYRRDLWHRFELAYVATHIESDDLASDSEAQTGRVHGVHMTGQLVAIPGYRRPGKFQRWFADADIAALSFAADFGAGGHGLALYADTVLAGFYAQRVARGGDGVTAALGSSLGFRFRDEGFADWRDRIGVAHLPGLAAQFGLSWQGIRLDLNARLHGDFAGLHARPYADWEAAYPDETGKSILRKQGYYYGWGYSHWLEAALSSPRVSIGGRVFYGRYHSQEGLDRTQELLTADVSADDTVIDRRAWLRVRPLSGALTIALTGRWRTRRSAVGEFTSDRALRRVSLWLGATL